MKILFTLYILAIIGILIYFGVAILIDKYGKSRHRNGSNKSSHNPRSDFFYQWYSGDDINKKERYTHDEI